MDSQMLEGSAWRDADSTKEEIVLESRGKPWRAESQVQGADEDPCRDEGPPGEEESGRQRVEGSLRQSWSNMGGGGCGQEGRGGLERQRDQPGALRGSPVLSG